MTKRQKLVKKLDIIFSKYIRKRDEGLPCIDLCGRPGVKQAGHFRRRECMATRWDERNVNGQNAYCNAWDNDGYRHAQGIDKKWGKGIAKELDKLSHTTKQWDEKELSGMIEKYKADLEKLSP